MLRSPITPEDPDTDGLAEDEAETEEPETGPLRRCLVTRERLPKEAMIRFVIGPDNRVVPDLAARLPGRGLWLSARADVLETARTRGAFAKAARAPVTVPPDLTPVLQAALLRRIGDTIGLARRAGQAVCGFQKAREWLVAGRVGLVIEAADGSADERARFLGRHAETMRVVQPLDGAALGAIFGRDHVVHVVVGKGKLAGMLAAETARLAGMMAPVAVDDRKGRTKKTPVQPGAISPPASPADTSSETQADQ